MIPFSDGLDSLATSAILERSSTHTLYRVRLVPHKQRDGRTDGAERPFAHVPFRVSCGSSREPTGRSRGFKFALLGGIAAYLTGSTRIALPESGLGVIGPALVLTGQEYQDYRCHPLFLDRMADFLAALLGHRVEFELPRLWHTKAETLIEASRCVDNLNSFRRTRSCWRDSRFASVAGKRRQCGICSGCLYRQASMYIARCRESREAYVWEDLSAARFEDGAAKDYQKQHSAFARKDAVAAVLQLDNVANTSRHRGGRAAINRTCFQLGQSLGLPQDDVTARLGRMLRQWQREWREFIASLGGDSFMSRWIH